MPIRRVRSFYPAFEKERHWHLENIGNLLESTRPHSVHAFFVLLHLLERKTEPLA